MSFAGSARWTGATLAGPLALPCRHPLRAFVCSSTAYWGAREGRPQSDCLLPGMAHACLPRLIRRTCGITIPPSHISVRGLLDFVKLVKSWRTRPAPGDGTQRLGCASCLTAAGSRSVATAEPTLSQPAPGPQRSRRPFAEAGRNLPVQAASSSVAPLWQRQHACLR